MNRYSHRSERTKSRAATHNLRRGLSSDDYLDRRPEFENQLNWSRWANSTSEFNQTMQLQALADNYVGYSEEQVDNEPNHTGLPDDLKSGIENLSGYSMDDVRVHYNSDKPAQLQAHAYAQGPEIHLGPGQEKHLPHEAWHVVQQKQGRVNPTLQMKGEAINDDQGLEQEADKMGNEALKLEWTSSAALNLNTHLPHNSEVIQRQIFYDSSIPEFQIDGKKPSFMGTVKKMVLAASESRDHIVPYAAIENDLAVLLNQFMANPAVWTTVVDFTEALYPGKAAHKEYADMVKFRNAIPAALGTGTAADIEKLARALLSRLNSSPDNIRKGDSGLNSAIGENLDVDFQAGTQKVAAAAGLQVNGNAGLVTLPTGTEYLKLKPASEVILYEYQKHTTQQLSFVFDSASNIQISSVDAPAPVGGAGLASVAGKPVIVFGPSAMDIPFYYS